MSEIVDKALALMLRHAANEASDYGDVRPATSGSAGALTMGRMCSPGGSAEAT